MTEQTQAAASRFKKFAATALAISAVMIPSALWYLSANGVEIRLHLAIALSLTITLSLLLAAGLMGLLFHSSASGHDNSIGETPDHKPET